MSFSGPQDLIVSGNVGQVQFMQELWVLREDRNWQCHDLL